jgi:hypothetical protein
LELSKSAAEALGKLTPERVKAQREAKAQAAEAKVATRAEREAREAEQRCHRDAVGQTRKAAALSDKLVSSALSLFQSVVDGQEGKGRSASTARRNLAQATANALAAREAPQQAQDRLAEAEARLVHHTANVAEFDAVENETIPKAREVVRVAFDESNKAWSKVPLTFRKANRDRQIKNWARKVLGLDRDVNQP